MSVTASNHCASLAALLMIGAGGTAHATMVEGTVSFPGGFLPAMTVYARAVDGGHLRSASTRESQGSFRFDLPPGRYVFFAEPSQAGAPQIFGAWTQSVLCRQHNSEDVCDDHAPITLVVRGTSIAGNAGPVIADWSIPDTLAEEFDRALGNRADPEPRELGAPRFSEYPVATVPAPQPATPPPAALLFTNAGVEGERQRLFREAMPAAPDFAGDVAVVRLSCGAACVDLLLLDWKSGQVQAPAPLAHIEQDLPCRADEAILYRRDSRLLSVTRRNKEDIVTEYFLWKSPGILTQTAEYRRSIERYCSLPNP